MLKTCHNGERSIQMHRQSPVPEKQVSQSPGRGSGIDRSVPRFGAGYVITLRLSEGLSNWNEAIFFMQHNFPSCILRVSFENLLNLLAAFTGNRAPLILPLSQPLQAHHHNMLEFSVPSNDVPLSSVFNNLKDAKEYLQLQDFFVSQTTLDQVSHLIPIDREIGPGNHLSLYYDATGLHQFRPRTG